MHRWQSWRYFNLKKQTNKQSKTPTTFKHLGNTHILYRDHMPLVSSTQSQQTGFNFPSQFWGLLRSDISKETRFTFPACTVTVTSFLWRWKNLTRDTRTWRPWGLQMYRFSCRLSLRWQLVGAPWPLPVRRHRLRIAVKNVVEWTRT